MGGEHLGDLGGGSVAAGCGLELFEGERHMPGVAASTLHELISEIVGGSLLLAGVFGLNHAFAEFAQDAVRKIGDGPLRGDGIAGGRGHQRMLVGIERMLEGYMAHFVADYAEHFLVGHDVHEAGIDAHVAVRTCEGVHFIGLVNLELERNAVHLGQAIGDLGKAGDVCAGSKHGVLCIQLGHGGGNAALNVRIGDGEGLGEFETALHHACGIVGGRAGNHCERGKCNEYYLFHIQSFKYPVLKSQLELHRSHILLKERIL